MSETSDRTIETAKRRKALAKPKGRVTMTDIARAAGCSQATVSFVLNNSPGIKLSHRAFGSGRRMPMAAKFNWE